MDRTISLTQTGANQIDLLVACAKGAGAACGTSTSTSATISNVQRPYAAVRSSGPIVGAWLSEVGGASQGANSFEVCEPQTRPAARTTSRSPSTSPPASRTASTSRIRPIRSGSGRARRTSSAAGPIQAPFASEYRDNLANGCTGPFAVNTSDPSCADAGTSPYDCVKLVNGVKTGGSSRVSPGRIADAPPEGYRYYCKNNWTDNNHGGVPIIPADDSRVIPVFVMPFGSTDGSGNPLLASGYVPIQTFATFYVTGFAGDPCASDDPAAGGRRQRLARRPFFKYIDTVNTGGDSGTACQAGSLGRCVAVMTR